VEQWNIRLDQSPLLSCYWLFIRQNDEYSNYSDRQ